MKNLLIYIGSLACAGLAVSKLVALAILFSNEQVDSDSLFVMKQAVYAMFFAAIGVVVWSKREKRLDQDAD